MKVLSSVLFTWREEELRQCFALPPGKEGALNMMRSPARFTGRWSAPGGYGGMFPLTSVLSLGGERKTKEMVFIGGFSFWTKNPVLFYKSAD